MWLEIPARGPLRVRGRGPIPTLYGSGTEEANGVVMPNPLGPLGDLPGSRCKANSEERETTQEKKNPYTRHKGDQQGRPLFYSQKVCYIYIN